MAYYRFKYCIYLVQDFINVARSQPTNLLFKNIRPKVLYKIGVHVGFVEFTRKRLCRNLFLNKDADWRPATLLKIDCSTDVLSSTSFFRFGFSFSLSWHWNFEMYTNTFIYDQKQVKKNYSEIAVRGKGESYFQKVRICFAT